MDFNNYQLLIKSHYAEVWHNEPTIHTWKKGPVHELPEGFCVLRFSSSNKRTMWTYATCGMSLLTDDEPLELHLFSPKKNDDLIELLTIIAHYHRTGSVLGLGHTVNFGRPWWKNSLCDYGLISSPYIDGPELEWMNTDIINTRFLWLIPVTKEEVDFKKNYGLESLEERFDNPNFNYLNPLRNSII